MNAAAITTFVIIAGIVWGGFTLILVTAVRREAAKESEERAKPGP